jgi:hypothetical protein
MNDLDATRRSLHEQWSALAKDPRTDGLLDWLTIAASFRASSSRHQDWAHPLGYEQVIAESPHTRWWFPDTLIPLPDGIAAGEARACYRNAVLIAATDPDRYAYVEGYATSGLLVVEHAWVLDRVTGQYLDPTWAALQERDSTISTNQSYAYAGIGFVAEVAYEWIQEREGAIFAGDWRTDHVILRQGLAYDSDGLVTGLR